MVTEHAMGRLSGRRFLSPTYWLIVRHENGEMEALTIDFGDGGEALPVFSFEEEAEMFLGLGGFGGGWQVRESVVGELTSVLFGPSCVRVGRVALDPLPMVVAGTTANLLVSLDREQFIGCLTGNGILRLREPDLGNPPVKEVAEVVGD